MYKGLIIKYIYIAFNYNMFNLALYLNPWPVYTRFKPRYPSKRLQCSNTDSKPNYRS